MAHQYFLYFNKIVSMSVFFIHHLIVITILTQKQKIDDQFDTIERLRTILTQMS
jgi:hypothetical protein